MYQTCIINPSRKHRRSERKPPAVLNCAHCTVPICQTFISSVHTSSFSAPLLQTWTFFHSSVCVWLYRPCMLMCVYVWLCTFCHLSVGAVFPQTGHQITAVYYTDRLTHWTIIIPLNHFLSFFSTLVSHSVLLIHLVLKLTHLLCLCCCLWINIICLNQRTRTHSRCLFASPISLSLIYSKS